MALKVSLFNFTKKKNLMVAAVAETAPLTDLDPELLDFYSCTHITPTLKNFHNKEDQSDPELCGSNGSSGIEEESELKKFTQAL
jgi:hypothetical protein